MENLVLLPAPRHVERLGGRFVLQQGRLILLDAAHPHELLAISQHIQTALTRSCGLTWQVVASPATPSASIGLTLRVGPSPATAGRGPDSYHLIIDVNGIIIESNAPSGLFYGVCTLIQILEQTIRGSEVQADLATAMPCLAILDWPDFTARGVMLDISRDKVPTMDTLYRLVDMLAGWKINQLQLYTEHTFAYRRHPEIWANASPLTGQELLDLDAYCRDRYVELVPNQNSFGHMERWLRHPRYTPLAEICGEIETPWGHFRGPYSLCPTDPASLEFLGDLYDELLPHFTSRQFNVGCDETWDVGQGRSRDACLAAGGAASVYLDFLLNVQAAVHARGHTMQFWADILIQHPELIPPALGESIALDWGYEADHPFAAHAQQLARAGLPFYVCPGTSSWCSIAGRTDNALANLQNAAQAGLEYGAIGYLNTDWGDHGHWQALPVSYLGFAAGAAYGWAWEANCDLDLAGALNLHAFHDSAGVLGQVAFDLGNVYRASSLHPTNGSALFQVMQKHLAALREDPRLARLGEDDFARSLEAIDAAVQPLAGACPGTADGDLVLEEFDNTERLLRHACHRGLLAQEAGDRGQGARDALDRDMQEILYRYEAAWLARNRPGGLADSMARLERVRTDYRH